MMTTKSTDSEVRAKLITLLQKLDLKSAKSIPGILDVEDLHMVLKSVTFNIEDLKLWSKIPK